MLVYIKTLTAGFLLLLSFSIVSSSAQETPVKALLITGGGWHDYETQERLLIDGINEQVDVEIEWTVVHEGDGEPDYHVSILKEENWAAGYDVVVHNTGFGRVTDPEFVAKFVKNHHGTPAVFDSCRNSQLPVCGTGRSLV